jgi:hypothetical protein
MKKPATKPKEMRTPGTRAVEKYRPRMNRLTDAEREKLLVQAMADWPKGFFSLIRLSEPAPFRRPSQGEHRDIRL